MSKKKKKYAGVRRVWINWHGMRKCKSNSQKEVMCYFLGAWTAFDNEECIEFIRLCTRKDMRLIMTYPIWN